MPDLRVINSLQDIDKQQWNACFSGEVKNYDYLLAIEESALAGFSFRYLTVWSGNTLQAAAPMFLTHYSLDTTVQGVGRKLTTRIKRMDEPPCVVILTFSAEPRFREQALAAGADGFLCKDRIAQDLMAQIEALFPRATGDRAKP